MTIISKTLNNIVRYLTEGFARIFSPTDDQYPAVGVQPFGGEIYYPSAYSDY